MVERRAGRPALDELDAFVASDVEPDAVNGRAGVARCAAGGCDGEPFLSST
jgi:hypothetical protein